MIDGYRPECQYNSFLFYSLDVLTVSNELPTAPYSMGTHESPPHDGYGDHSYDDGPSDPRMTRLQIFLQRSVGGWPLYTIIISFGQLLSAVSDRLRFVLY
jgi:alpha-1,3-glucan synthase